MIYLIGGAPRVGKTSMVQEAVKLKPMHAVSTDAIRYMLRHSLPKDVLDPALFSADKDLLSVGKVDEVLTHQNAESEALWLYILQLMQSYALDGCDLLVEGVAVLPSLLSQLELPYKSVIIGNTSPGHEAKIVEIARQNEHDWLHRYTEEEAINSARFFTHMSKWLASECQHSETKYFEINDETFQEDIVAAAKELLG
jgi:2-phosphoglycerate kinase